MDEVTQMVAELTRITILWEEEWIVALQMVVLLHKACAIFSN